MTLGEIRKGIESLRDRDSDQAEAFAAWLDELHTTFAERIVPIDIRVAEEWGALNATRPRNTRGHLTLHHEKPASSGQRRSRREQCRWR